jgi:hypothetical protein
MEFFFLSYYSDNGMGTAVSSCALSANNCYLLVPSFRSTDSVRVKQSSRPEFRILLPRLGVTARVFGCDDAVVFFVQAAFFFQLSDIF